MSAPNKQPSTSLCPAQVLWSFWIGVNGLLRYRVTSTGVILQGSCSFLVKAGGDSPLENAKDPASACHKTDRA